MTEPPFDSAQPQEETSEPPGVTDTRADTIREALVAIRSGLNLGPVPPDASVEETNVIDDAWSATNDVYNITTALLADAAEQRERYLAVESKAILHDDAMARAEAAEARVAALETALACFHDEDRWTYLQYEGETWSGCPDCGLIEKWAGGQRFEQKIAPEAFVAASAPATQQETE